MPKVKKLDVSKQRKRRIHLITGASGSGKSFMKKKYTDYRPVATDDFYIGKSLMKPDKNGILNFDHPSAVNLSECKAVIKALAYGNPGDIVQIPHYDMKTSERIGYRNITIPDYNAIIVVEGIFAFHLMYFSDPNDPETYLITIDDEFEQMIDFKIFVEASSLGLIVGRRFNRDQDERARTPKNILDQMESVIQGYKDYILPMKRLADFVETNGILV